MKKFIDWLIKEKNDVSYDYSCVLFAFPNKEASEILKWSEENISEDLLYKEDKQFGREDEVHTTVLYGLHSNKPDEVRKIASTIDPFEITLGEISKFDTNDKYDVIKIGVSGKGLNSFNKKLRELKHTSNYKDYKAHCTIAYVKKGSCDDLLGNKDFNNKKIMVKSVKFSPSNGDKIILKLRSEDE